VVGLHGFTYTGEQFRAFSRLIGAQIVAPDLPGHGETTIDPVNLETTVQALVALLEQLGPSPLLGYSQGGRLAILVALARGDLVPAMVAVSASPGDPNRAARRRADERLAVDLMEGGVDRFLDAWLSGPPTGTDHLAAAVRVADREIRQANTASGLAAALRGYGQGVQRTVLDELRLLVPPTQFVAGERDPKYVRLAEQMATAARLGGSIVVVDSGHNVVLDNPHALAAIVADHILA